MRYKAIFLDFYGTLVYEDDDAISQITRRISLASPNQPAPKDITSFWWKTFSSLLENSFHETFQTQRELESLSLEATFKHFNCAMRTNHIDIELFAHWVKPAIFTDTTAFLAKCPLPVCIVSNIDRNDIQEAIHYHKLSFAGLVTSEDARSYKPREEIFRLALENMGLSSSQVLHVGDSLTSDIAGAYNCGIDSFWLNRKGKSLPPEFRPTYCGNSLLDILNLL